MSVSLGIIIDERLSRERALWITQVVKKLRGFVRVEFIKSDTPPEQWPNYLLTHPEAKLLVPAHRTRDTLRLEDPNRFGFYTCEPLTPEHWQNLLTQAPDQLRLQCSLWNWNPGEKRLASLLSEMRAWLGVPDTQTESHTLLSGTIGEVMDRLSTANDPARARRLLLTLNELQPHAIAQLQLEWTENASIRSLRVTVPTRGQRVPQLFTSIARNSRLALDTNFVRARWSPQDDLLEISVAQYPWVAHDAQAGSTAPYSYWWGSVPSGQIAPVLTSSSPGNEPRLTQATLQPDASTLRENERLRALIQELKDGGVGQGPSQALAPPETHVLLEAFKQRYFESKLEIRKLEAALAAPVPDIRVAAIKKRIDDLRTQHQEWIQILTDTLAQEKKRKSS